MDEEKDIKKTVVNLFEEAQKRGKRVPPPEKTTTFGDIKVEGNNTQIAGGDIVNYNAPPKQVTSRPFKPGPEHITAAQAQKIRDLIHKAAERTAGSDTGRIGHEIQSWWGRLKKRYEVSTYREIPAELGNHAIKWLQQQIAMNRPKLRRSNNQDWRKEHYSAIWAKSREKGISKGEVYALVADRLGKQVTSLTKLGERDLKKLYHIIMSF